MNPRLGLGTNLHNDVTLLTFYVRCESQSHLSFSSGDFIADGVSPLMAAWRALSWLAYRCGYRSYGYMCCVSFLARFRRIHRWRRVVCFDVSFGHCVPHTACLRYL